MADQNFIESGYFVPDHGYYVYTADVAANVATRFSLTSNPTTYTRVPISPTAFTSTSGVVQYGAFYIDAGPKVQV